MIRLMARRNLDVAYFTGDRARELEGIRDGGPGWWIRGRGDAADPRAVQEVLTSTGRARVVGYDLVVAAPRSVSILIALDEERAPGVVAAHREAVRSAIDYLEDRAVVVRDRRGGETRSYGARWSSVVAFTHGVNRHGEPHLHDHVLVGSRPEGADVVLDVRALVAHAPTADALYRSGLRYGVARRTGLEVWRSFEGVEHVAGLDEGFRTLWPGHHRDRGQKTLWERDEIRERWRADRSRAELVGAIRVPRVTRDHLDEHRFAGAFEGRLDVARRHVVRAWADAAPYGRPASGVVDAVDALYPSLRRGRGVNETSIGVIEARMTERVRVRGPRPLERDGLADWAQRSRVRAPAERSR